MARPTPRPAAIPAAVALVAALAVMLLAARGAQAALSCSTVYQDLSPCINYIQAGGGPVPTGCCDGISGLVTLAKTGGDRRAACQCLKDAATQFGTPSIIRLASGLPAKCGVSIPYKIGTSTDCSKVH